MINEEKIITRLNELLSKSVKECCQDEKVGIVFSGGIDSTVIAILAKNFSRIIGYTVGSENSRDVEAVKKLRGDINFEIKIKKLEIEETKKNLAKILGIIGKRDPLQVSCAIPIYFAAREARGDGIKIMLSGQGSDELFGGYNRYLQYISDYQKLEKILEKDVKNAYDDNLRRDIAICAANDIDLKFPFMNKELVEFALKIPANLKIKEGEEFSCIDEVDGKKVIRKYILRRAALEIKVLDIVLNRPKKALQYGSSSWKILQKIAREGKFKEVGLYLESLDLN